MGTFAIDPDRTSFTVGVKPQLPGTRVRIGGVTGSFEATLDGGGVDWDAPLAGSFTLAVDDLTMANPLLADGTRRALAVAGQERITGTLRSAEPADGDHSFTATFDIDALGRSAAVRGAGRFEDDPATGGLRVAGRSICDPRAFGVPLPPLVNFVVHVRWRVGLTPT